MRTIAVNVHYIVDNRKERGVLLKRCVVIPMPFKSTKVQLSTCKAPAVVPRVLPPEKSPVEWLKHGVQSKINKKCGCYVIYW